jgi:hypothetical protein
MLGGKGLGLLLQEGGKSAFGHAAACGVGDRLEGEQINVQTGAGIAEGATCNNFAPLGGQFANLLEFLGCELVCGHEQTLLGLTLKGMGALLPVFYDKVLQRAKPVLASPFSADLAGVGGRHIIL